MREIKGCKCHAHILISNMSDQKKTTQWLQKLGNPFVFGWGAVGIDFAHGGVERVCDFVIAAFSPRLVLLLTAASPSVRTVVTTFLEDSGVSWQVPACGYWAGLVGTAKGYTIAACKALGRKNWDAWHEPGACHDGAHRVTVYFHTNEALVRQLFEFSFGEAMVDVIYFPLLFVFSLDYAVTSWVGQYLEGRHRHISLQLSRSSTNTLPG